MTEQKNQRAILEVARKIKETPADDDIQFLIVGTGPLETELLTRAEQLGVEDIVTFTGFLSRREHVYQILHRSDVFLVPSRYEGFCVAAVEAMACGLPVVASDIRVFHEVIGSHGLFAPHDDIEKLSDKVTTALSTLDGDSMEKRKQALQERAETTFPLERTASEYHRLYSDIL